ncbi:MAG: S8 family serine peptidase, partial [Bacteroidetes bacterium]|nr:S8 family serine peptidase [Bacteroidota bacterium]
MKFKSIVIFILISSCFFLNGQNTFNKSYIIKLKTAYSQATSDYLSTLNIQGASTFNSCLNYFNEIKNEKILSSETNQRIEELRKYITINIPSGIDSEKLLSMIKNNYDIESIEPNYIYRIETTTDEPNDPLYKDQWALKIINSTKAWEKATGKGIIVGIIDTGIDFEHPDLKNQLYINSKEDINHNGKFEPWSSEEIRNGITGDFNNIDDDYDGFIDDVIGYDFVDQSFGNIGDYIEPDSIPYDEHSHGTTLAGVIAAERNNNIGISGLAYDSKLLAVRALDATGNGESDDIANAIVYAALRGAKVLNFSFGEAFPSTIMHEAIKFAYSLGCVMTASSGNNNWQFPHYPSDYEEVISVGAITDKGQKSSVSNYGNRLALTAPGNDILTTTPGGNYQKKSGTSYSAPYVSAASALLFELDSTLKPQDIKGILMASADDAGDIGWDIYYGAGILNVGKAVNTIGRTSLNISYPVNDSYINKNNTPIIPIIGDVITPLFDSYQVFVGLGYNPDNWQPFSNIIISQKLQDTLAVINFSSLPDTSSVIRILVNLKNGNTLEKRINIEILSNNNNFEVNNKIILSALYNEKRVTLIAIETNYKSSCSVKFRPKNSTEQYKVLSDANSLTKYHLLVVDDICPPEVPMDAEISLKRQDGFELTYITEFTRSGNEMPQSGFTMKNYSIPLSYLTNHVADLYNDGKPSIIVNDISDGNYGKIKVFEFNNSNFDLKDSAEVFLLPKSIGNTNADNLPDILTTGNGRTVLFQPESLGSSPFSNILYQSPDTINLWAYDLFDIDKDGKDEIVCHDDTSVIILSYKNDKYQISAKINPPKNLNNLNTYPGIAEGDFDGDGKNEIFISTWNGNILIYEYDNAQFNLVFNNERIITDGEQFACTADIEGDGKPEILVGNYGSNFLYEKNYVGEPLWRFRVLKGIADNTYEFIWTDYIYGVRAGLHYKEGISSGNLDGKPGDEIIISAFPNLYVFTYKNKIEPLWWYPYSYSNDAIIYDFDKNGVNELGFSTFSRTRFFEYDPGFNGPKPPLGIKGWALNDSTAYIKWNSSIDAEHYQVLMLVSDSTAQIVGETDTTFYTVNNLSANNYYHFAVRSINTQLSDSLSDISEVIEVFTHNPIKLDSVIVHNQKELIVIYSGKIPTKIDPSNFNIFDSDSLNHITSVSCIPISDTSFILNFNSSIYDFGKYFGNNFTAASFPDFYGTPTILVDYPGYGLNIPNDTIISEVYLKNLKVISSKELQIEFSEPIVDSTAMIFSNYILKPYGIIENILFNPDNPSTVNIVLSNTLLPGSYGKTYTITAANINSLTGNKMTKGAGNTLAFTFNPNSSNDAFIYPNPVRLGEMKDVYFGNILNNSEIDIMTFDGHQLRTLYENDNNGGIEWDVKDENNNLLNPNQL